MNISIVIQIIVLVLELIAKGMSESQAINHASNVFGVSKKLIKRWI